MTKLTYRTTLKRSAGEGEAQVTLDYLPVIESLSRLGDEFSRTGFNRREGWVVTGSYGLIDPRSLSREAAIAYHRGSKYGDSNLKSRLSRIDPRNIVISHGRIADRDLRVYGIEEEGDPEMLLMLDDLGFVGLENIPLDKRQLKIPETSLIWRYDFANVNAYADSVVRREAERQRLGRGTGENGYDLHQLRAGLELFKNPPADLDIEVVGDWSAVTTPVVAQRTNKRLSIDQTHLRNVEAYLTDGTETPGLTVITKPANPAAKAPAKRTFSFKTKAQGGGRFSSSDEKPEEY